MDIYIQWNTMMYETFFAEEPRAREWIQHDEPGCPILWESTMLAIMGHMSRAMLERYSHIRTAAKREAVEALRLTPKPAYSDHVPAKVPSIEAIAKIQER